MHMNHSFFNQAEDVRRHDINALETLQIKLFRNLNYNIMLYHDMVTTYFYTTNAIYWIKVEMKCPIFIYYMSLIPCKWFHNSNFILYSPPISVASQRQTCPKAPSPNMWKNFSLCRGNSHCLFPDWWIVIVSTALFDTVVLLTKMVSWLPIDPTFDVVWDISWKEIIHTCQLNGYIQLFKVSLYANI